MKKVLITLLVLVLIAGIGFLGYTAYNKLIAEPKKQAESSQSDSSSTASSGVETVQFNVMKKVESPADIIDAIDGQVEKNQDTIGWINIPDTKISASVLQSFNNDFYLRRDEKKKDNVYGCYFADFTCNFGTRDMLSSNTVIYGHSDLTDNPDGPRFSQLFKFTDQQFAKEHPIIYFSTQEETMAWQIFAVSYTDLKFDFTKSNYDAAGIASYAAGAKARSIYTYDVPVSGEDKLLTLVTCTIKYGKEKQEKQRFIVVAKLLPSGEKEPTSAPLEVNANPQQPVL